MCLIAFDWQPESDRILTLIANRDEFYHRPSRPADYWPEHEHIYGGQDLEMGGTWLAASTRFRFAAVTNFRHPDKNQYPLSRGLIPKNFLNSSLDAVTWCQAQINDLERYAGFNAILFDGSELIYLSNRSQGKIRTLPSGLFGLSNHLLDTPWPKVRKAKQALRSHLNLSEPQTQHQKLLKEFRNKELANDHQLPDTGVGLQLERMLSPMFIESPSYGTRTSTAVSIYKNGQIDFTERNYMKADDVNDNKVPAFQETHHSFIAQG